ncbi:hypothetical protein G7070_04035 [Propioniciclava coleopterorum]|uniref:Uncharacterized protein n=1 Tax=Propioniciclava coleopterorum TaxID=2714937 RepID=A0A6G7Y455_9ACTN|nr:hypothetical protein [Propioniciclava coleopterorum]QIK71595.1 hypothetical protein G7070_04035 [Propioniciclava coleopterorum]
MSLPRRAAAAAIVLAVSAGCTPGSDPTPPITPTPTRPTETASPTPTPSEQIDLLERGAAVRLVDRLLDAADTTRAIMVTVTAETASVAVLRNGAAETWAWRDGRVQQVQSDINYVTQREFDPHAFDFDDLPALFRAAQAVSGSDADQSLQIVDISAGLVSMSVSTNPETRPVFFNPDGTLLPTLDFSSEWGLKQGYEDVVGPRGTTTGMGFGSALGVYLDSPQDTQGAFTRRQRTARTPVIVTNRTDANRLAAFDPARVKPAVVWSVLQGMRDQGTFTLDTTWSCIVDDRTSTGTPKLYFQVGDRSFVTDLLGNVLS